MVGSEVVFGGSLIMVEKVQNQYLILITPKSKRIRALEELRRPQTKKDCQVFAGMISSLQRWNPTVALEIPLIRKRQLLRGVSYGVMRCRGSGKSLGGSCWNKFS